MMPTLTPRLQRFLDRNSHSMIIDGDSIAVSSDQTIAVVNPATEEVIAHVGLASAGDVDRAVSSARLAFDNGPWRTMAPMDRERILLRFADLVEEQADSLAQLITLENGKLVGQARSSDAIGASKTLRYYAGWATKIEGSTLDLSLKQKPGKQNFAFIRREPVGVVAAIVPWNFPVSIAAWKIAPALAAGCTVVLKPSEETPLSALMLGELALEAGMPAGVLNVLTGDGATTGAALVAHPDIDKVTFTGSTATGKQIGKSAMDHLTGISLELGGKSPVVVFDDADFEEAAKGIAAGIFRNQGQVCVAGSRVYIQKKHFDRVLQDVCDLGKKMRISHGFDPDADLGPLVSSQHLERVKSYIGKGVEEGAVLESGGKQVARTGYFLEPTVFSSEDNQKVIIQEEIFGPVLVGVPFDDIEDALQKANDTPFGLSSSVWTQNINTAHQMIDGLKAGWVFVNAPGRSDPNLPLGGYKQSGIGRELGRQGLYQFTTTKSVNIVY